MMWVAPKGNMREGEAGTRRPSMKMQGIEDENKSILVQIWNEVKDIKMAIKLMEIRVYDALKILVALNVIICISVVIMLMK